MDSIVRSKSPNYIHGMTSERLSTYETPQEHSQWTETTVTGAILDKHFAIWWLG